jgi:hypothetical protein
LAGVSVEYYKRLERGNASGVVRYHRSGTKRLHHPVVGELELDYEVMDVSADDGVTISVYSAEPGSRSEQALDLLSSWTAAPERSPTTVDE